MTERPATRVESGKPVRVLVIESHARFRTTLRAALEEQGLCVVDTPTVEAALPRLGAFRPHVVLMDDHSAGNGERLRVIRGAAPETPVVVVTLFPERRRVVAALRAGAAGCIFKGAELGDILAAIRTAGAGHRAVAPTAPACSPAPFYLAPVRRAATTAPSVAA